MKRCVELFLCLIFVSILSLSAFAEANLTDTSPSIKEQYTDVLQEYSAFKDKAIFDEIKPAVSDYASSLVSTLVTGLKQNITSEIVGPDNASSGSKFSIGNITKMVTNAKSLWEKNKNPSEWFIPLKQELDRSVEKYGAAMNSVSQGKDVNSATDAFLKSFKDLDLGGDIEGQLRTLTARHFQDITQILNGTKAPANTTTESCLASWLKLPLRIKGNQS